MRSKAHSALTAPLVLHHTRIYKRAMKKIIFKGQMRNKLFWLSSIILHWDQEKLSGKTTAQMLPHRDWESTTWSTRESPLVKNGDSTSRLGFKSAFLLCRYAYSYLVSIFDPYFDIFMNVKPEVPGGLHNMVPVPYYDTIFIKSAYP